MRIYGLSLSPHEAMTLIRMDRAFVTGLAEARAKDTTKDKEKSPQR